MNPQMLFRRMLGPQCVEEIDAADSCVGAHLAVCRIHPDKPLSAFGHKGLSVFVSTDFLHVDSRVSRSAVP